MENIIKYISEHTMINRCLTVSFAFLMNLFIPILPIIAVCFIAILIDLYYGVKVSNEFNVKIQSHYSWSGTLNKMRDTLIMLSLGHLIECYIIGADSPLSVLVGTIALLVTVTEMWSILENLNTLNPNGPWKVLSFILRDKSKRHLNIDVDKYKQMLQKENDNKNGKNSITASGLDLCGDDRNGDDCQYGTPDQECKTRKRESDQTTEH